MVENQANNVIKMVRIHNRTKTQQQKLRNNAAKMGFNINS